MAAEAGAHNQKEHKLASSLVLVLALFIICWLPLHVIQAITYYNQNIHVPSIALYFGILLSHANSMVNPVVYAFKIPKIKREYRKIWRKVIGRQQQADISATASNTTDSHDARVHARISPHVGVDGII